MAQFTLDWNNSKVLANTNATGQRVSYRARATGGAYITAGFVPSNDLAVTVTQADSPILPDNKVFQFKVEALCTQGGPIMQDNGMIESIIFDCIPSVAGSDYMSASISIDTTNTDIEGAKIVLKKSSDNSIVGAEVTVAVVNNAIIRTVPGLQESTDYYWEYKLQSTINNILEYSEACTKAIRTTSIPVCNPVTSVTVNSVEIL